MKGMQNMLRQANQLQAKIRKLQEDLAVREHDGSAGGGGVTVKLKGDTEFLSVHINADLVKSADTEMIQDLVLAACNDALKKSKTVYQQEMEKATGGFGVPGLF
jgi:hypothetical protein